MGNKKFIRKGNKTLKLYSDGGSLTGLSSSIGSMFDTSRSLSSISDLSKTQQDIESMKSLNLFANNNNDLMSQLSTNRNIGEMSYQDVRGSSNSSQWGGIGKSSLTGAAAGASIGSVIPGIGTAIGAGVGALAGFTSGLIGKGIGDKKAKEKQIAINKDIADANLMMSNNFTNKINSIDTNNDMRLKSNYFSKGGRINTSGSINGGVFSNGVTKIDNGGTHEQNPLMGVGMGVDQNGNKNLVEQGEVKFNDYVFSNRLFLNKGLSKSANLPKSYNNNSFAFAAEKASKESAERPNDPISKRGLYSSMTRLQQAQELLKQEQTAQDDSNKNILAYGGDTKNNYKPEFDFNNSISNSNYKRSELDLDMLNNSPIGNRSLLNNSPVNQYASMPNQYLWSQNKQAQDTLAGTDSESNNSNKFNFSVDKLRYAPVLGSAINVATDFLGITNRPNYENANMIANATNNLGNVSAETIGNKLTYNPLDRDYYINKLNAQSGASRRAIENQSGGNRATATAGILASDYNYGQSLGQLARQSEEFNQAQRERVEAFNRGTNQYNADAAMRANAFNQNNNQLKLSSAMQQAQLRENIDLRSSTGRSMNLTNFFENIGDVGREEFSKNLITSNPANLYYIDNNGRVRHKESSKNTSSNGKTKIDKSKSNKKSFFTKK